MTHVSSTFVLGIGLLHLLQPPLTWLLAQRLRLRPAFESLPAIAYRVAENMATASVALPTLLGCYIAVYAEEALHAGPVRSAALAVSFFWTWRLHRQILAVGPLLAAVSPALNAVLTLIFIIEGPVLGALILFSIFGGAQ